MERERERERGRERERYDLTENTITNNYHRNYLDMYITRSITLLHNILAIFLQLVMFTPIALKVNCGYARTAIRELTPKKKGKYGRTVDKDKRTADFKGLFGHLSLQEEMFEKDSKGLSQFDYSCDAILDMFSKKWNPMVRTDYEAFFSTENWKRLSVNKKEHALSHCTACSTNHMHLQEAFPGKPVF